MVIGYAPLLRYALGCVIRFGGLGDYLDCGVSPLEERRFSSNTARHVA